MITLRVR